MRLDGTYTAEELENLQRLMSIRTPRELKKLTEEEWQKYLQIVGQRAISGNPDVERGRALCLEVVGRCLVELAEAVRDGRPRRLVEQYYGVPRDLRPHPKHIWYRGRRMLRDAREIREELEEREPERAA